MPKPPNCAEQKSLINCPVLSALFFLSFRQGGSSPHSASPRSSKAEDMQIKSVHADVPGGRDEVDSRINSRNRDRIVRPSVCAAGSNQPINSKMFPIFFHSFSFKFRSQSIRRNLTMGYNPSWRSSWFGTSHGDADLLCTDEKAPAAASIEIPIRDPSWPPIDRRRPGR